MLPGNVDLIAAERRREDRRRAERMRLIASLRRQEPRKPGAARKAARWMGLRLVSWGQKLQGGSAPPAVQMAVARVADGDCP